MAPKKLKRTTAKKAAASKIQKIAAMLRRGCTRGEILKATGWQSVSVQAMARSADIKLKVDDSVRPFRYRAAGAAK